MKKHIVLFISIIALLILITSCEQTQIAPEAKITDYDPLAMGVDSTSTWATMTSITIENTSSINAYITGYYVRYYDASGNSYAVWPKDANPVPLTGYMAASTIDYGVLTTSSYTLEDLPFPLIDNTLGVNVYNHLISEQTGSARIFFVIEDDNGYEKVTEIQLNVGLFLAE